LADKDETAGFFRNIISVIDTLLSRGLVPKDKFKNWHERRSQLNALLTRTLKSLTLERSRLQAKRDGNEHRKNSEDAYYTFTPVPASVRWKPDRVRAEKIVKKFAYGESSTFRPLPLAEQKAKVGRDDHGFADSPGELGMREQ
jgi:hypothetical protein